MKGKALAVVVAGVLLATLFLTLRWDLRRLEASRALHQAEIITVGALSVGQVPRVLLQQNIRDLRQAAEKDPLEVGIPIALGSQYLLLRSPQASQEAYRSALALESRPEIYLNLGKAYQLAGDLNEAWKFYDQALLLDHHMEAQIPVQAHRRMPEEEEAEAEP